MDAIRDDGGHPVTPLAFESVEDFMDSVRYRAAHLKLDQTAGQPELVIVMCEAGRHGPAIGARRRALRLAGDFVGRLQSPASRSRRMSTGCRTSIHGDSALRRCEAICRRAPLASKTMSAARPAT